MSAGTERDETRRAAVERVEQALTDGQMDTQERRAARATVQAADRARRSVPAVEPMRGVPPEILPDPPAADPLERLVASAVLLEVVMAPNDRLIIALGAEATHSLMGAYREQLKAHWPDVADRVLFVNGPVTGMALIEGEAT